MHFRVKILAHLIGVSYLYNFNIIMYLFVVRRTAAFLEKDSGILLQAPEVTEFCKSVMEGKWSQVDDLLPSLAITRESDIAVYQHPL
jgi:hypothetical protein